VRRVVSEGSGGEGGVGARRGWEVGSGRGRECDETESCGGSMIEGSGEVTMCGGGGCGEEEEFN
jgi:hypothetical protein